MQYFSAAGGLDGVAQTGQNYDIDDAFSSTMPTRRCKHKNITAVRPTSARCCRQAARPHPRDCRSTGVGDFGRGSWSVPFETLNDGTGLVGLADALCAFVEHVHF